MKWTTRRHKKLQKRLEWRGRDAQWHEAFAILPVRIPATKYDSIVIPEHRVWLEWLECRVIFQSDNDLRPEFFRIAKLEWRTPQGVT